MTFLIRLSSHHHMSYAFHFFFLENYLYSDYYKNIFSQIFLNTQCTLIRIYVFIYYLLFVYINFSFFVIFLNTNYNINTYIILRLYIILHRTCWNNCTKPNDKNIIYTSRSYWQGIQDGRAFRSDDIQNGYGRLAEVRVHLHGVRDGILTR